MMCNIMGLEYGRGLKKGTRVMGLDNIAWISFRNVI